jgi:HYDIN/CFA65/VesB-like, Ig-like domain/Abnormal spindle-like microcephaly-assoc'd, ASPM-SPD-2-Hydin
LIESLTPIIVIHMDARSVSGRDKSGILKKQVAPLLGLLLVACLVVFGSGCSGVVNGSSTNSNNSGGGNTSTPQLSIVPSSVNFSTVVVGQKNTQTLQLSNTGSAALNIQNIQVSGTGFSVTPPTLPLSLAVGASQNLTLAFAPASAAAAKGTLTITSNDPNSPASVSLQGTGQASTAQLQFSPASVSFGTVTVATKVSQSATLKNTGNVSVTLSKVTATGSGFGVTNLASGLALSPQQQTSFQVSFDPTAAGAVAGSLSVSGNGLSAPLTMSLSGTGQAATSNPHSVALSWGASTSSVAGYDVFRGNTSGGPYHQINSSTVTSLGYTDSSVSAGSTYYYVVTSVDPSGVQSVYSNQVSAKIPTP